MRYLICALGALATTACVPAKPQAMPRPAPPVAIARTPPPELGPLPAPAAAVVAPRVISREISGITFEGVSFDSRSHQLVVIDQPSGPGSRFSDAESAALPAGGIAAINAGFFTPEGKPLGLVVSEGKSSGAWNSASSLGSGVWYEKTGGLSAIVRREKLGSSAARQSSELIQAGPLLVENGNALGGLEATKTSARSMILWDGGTRWWIGSSSPCTLAALGSALGRGRPAGWKIQQAINLDGGRSTDLWISGNIPGGPISRRSPWNRAVRNFLVLAPR